MTFKDEIKRIKEFVDGTADEHIGAFAAQTAFFIFLAFFPLVSLIMSLSRFLPVSQTQIIEFICNVLPGRFEEYVISIVNEIYSGQSYTMTIVSAAIALWSSAKGLMAIRNGLNEVYRSREQRNYFLIRGISSIYTALFLVMLVIMIPLNMFGTQIALIVMNFFPNLNELTLLVYGLRTAVTFIVLFFFFWMLFTIVPSRKLKFSRQVPGSAFTAGTWVLGTKLFSLYIDQFLSNSYMYGSLTMVILIMLWLYFVVNMIFIGGQINEYLYIYKYKEMDREIKERRLSMREKKKEEKRLKKLAKKGLADEGAEIEAEEIAEEKIVGFEAARKRHERKWLKKIRDNDDNPDNPDNFDNDEITM